MANKIHRTSLQLEIIRYIQSYIEENDLKAGDKLPSQEKLLEMMGVSRTSLREAMKTLEARNVLKVCNGKGVYVNEKQDNAFLTLIDFTKEKGNLLEALEIRRILEHEIIRMVIQRATNEELEELGEITGILMKKYLNGERHAMEDKKFHNMIYRLSHSEVMYQLILSIRHIMDQFWQYPLDMEDPFLASTPLHKTLYEAICERNVKKAQSINEQLLNIVFEEIKDQK